MAAVRAVVDADTLYRRHQRNVLAWHALEGLFDLHWSMRILDETRRHLVASAGLAESDAVRAIGRLTDAIRIGGAGDEAPERDIAALEDQMTNDPKDRHVLAAAVACQASVIVTTNKSDFPSASTTSHGVSVLTPDEFLVSVVDREPVDAALRALQLHAGFHGWSVGELLALLASKSDSRPAVAPRYVALIEDRTGIRRAQATRQRSSADTC